MEEVLARMVMDKMSEYNTSSREYVQQHLNIASIYLYLGNIFSV
jgi:hypothetical protein